MDWIAESNEREEGGRRAWMGDDDGALVGDIDQQASVGLAYL